ncbi:hypothetical protein AN1V17_16920 [Vallitalea sediminicola]
MRRVKRSFKKTLCILLTAGMVISSLTACGNAKAKGSDNDNGEVVVLDNQQKDINDVLAIKQIIEVKDFAGFHWLDDNRILGVAIKDGIRNIAIYNVRDKTVENVTNNKDTNKGFEYWYEQANCLDQYKLSENYVLFMEQVIEQKDSYISEPYALLFYDINEGKLIRIDGNVVSSKYINEDQMYYTKGFQVYRYDMASKQKIEIELPEELINNLKDYFDSYEEYLDLHYGEDREELSEFSKKISTKFYENEKKNNKICRIQVKGYELEVVSCNGKNFIFNMKNNTFKEGYIKSYDYDKDVIEIDDVAKVIQNKIPRELWKTDDNGNLIKMIDKTHDFVGGFYLSPDKSKLIYEAIYPMGEERKYIYDFKSDKKVTIFGECKSLCWNKDSNKIVCSESVYFYKELSCKIVNFND